jgi:hypothetical protein
VNPPQFRFPVLIKKRMLFITTQICARRSPERPGFLFEHFGSHEELSMKAWWMLAALIVLACPAGAQTRMAAIGGAGRETCAAWTEDRGAASESARLANERRIEWISGFFSAVNVFADSSGSLHGGIDDRDGMLAWIDNFCREHPNDPLWGAAANLVLDLRNRSRN